ncbi:2,3-bisphosphoglycerate-dependent phosphoglycerate mutase [Haploplasma axanthum]|uniref:2,3-bisphosphoglycerate-dependent phosphoglycerate mutase n=1 Tax=Haploplasma axanthum TaxID=29552 RepID=A0A449BDC2_HAPAX|nr:2,3-bisphosphoglycerate-dependent phosphoglycerate mutase [Haploplasma axanthum]VEU80461.1 2,3-bisphosphoglycerate-dependent phosphoglycerate mutase [Haploplasma axanthum]
MVELVVVRHGQSLWNLENRFTGWVDVDLTEKGVLEAREAGEKLVSNNYKFDIAYVSMLKRARHTLNIILNVLNESIPIIESKNLNERHYGGLQGQNKQEATIKFGEETVKTWRRSYDVRPPEAEKPNLSEPNGESLKDTYERVVKYFHETIEKDLKNHKKLLIVAHGNSLRALSKYLLKLSDSEIIDFEIPTGKPLVFKLDDNLNVISYDYLK